MKILAFSDIHRDTRFARKLVGASSDADILIGAGDFATRGEGASDVLSILSEVKTPTIIVSGNHDSAEELENFCQGWTHGHFLQGDGVTFDGVSFFGLGREIPRFNHSPWNEYMGEYEARLILANADPYDVLVTHTPPHGHVDTEVDDDHSGDHDGSTAILSAIEERQPALHLCGHMHDCWGQKSSVGKTSIHNLGPTLNWFTI
jgi:Icc-related predicted phosphoesterase